MPVRHRIMLDPEIVIETEDELLVVGRPAKINVLKNDCVILSLEAFVDKQRGADGKMYPAVIFKE